MRIKKILIVPAESIVEKEPPLPFAAFLWGGMAYAKRKFFGSPSVYHAELQRYGDIPKILGKENTYIVGQLYPHFFSAEFQGNCPYPSCHGMSEGTFINERSLPRVIQEVDALVVSVRAGRRGMSAIREAKKRKKPVAIIDAHDHLLLYGARNIRKELCRGFVPGRDFDLYFKNDLPLGFATDTVLPLAPCPVRPEVYRFRSLSKDIDIFYSGRARAKGQPDGTAVVELVRNNFSGARIFDHQNGHKDFLAVAEYWDYLSRSRAALSPSRFVWDSFRHCETGLAPDTLLIAPRPYVETAGPPLKDGENAILYDTKFSGGKYYLKESAGLVEKIRSYLEDPEKMKRVASAWRDDVKNGHTVYARSRYILERLERMA